MTKLVNLCHLLFITKSGAIYLSGSDYKTPFGIHIFIYQGYRYNSQDFRHDLHFIYLHFKPLITWSVYGRFPNMFFPQFLSPGALKNPPIHRDLQMQFGQCVRDLLNMQSITNVCPETPRNVTKYVMDTPYILRLTCTECYLNVSSVWHYRLASAEESWLTQIAPTRKTRRKDDQIYAETGRRRLVLREERDPGGYGVERFRNARANQTTWRSDFDFPLVLCVDF